MHLHNITFSLQIKLKQVSFRDNKTICNFLKQKKYQTGFRASKKE